MDTEKVIELLKKEWDIDDGFLGSIRYRRFRQDRLERLLGILNAIIIEDNNCLQRELVTLLWFMPLFLEWQKQGFQEAGMETEMLDSAVNHIVNELYRILGVP